ncbi:MAG: hypothetical protein ACRDQB_05840, partial [Thermocrispum sp.]
LQVVIGSLATGVGAVVLFALGVRGWSNHTDAQRAGSGSVLGVAVAAVSFLLCVALVVFGIWVIVAGH